jgi:23S rRNA pseudouridine1911/1915/1917 synthase
VTALTGDAKHRIKAEPSGSALLETDGAFAGTFEHSFAAVWSNKQKDGAKTRRAAIFGYTRHSDQQCGGAVSVGSGLVIACGANARGSIKCVDLESGVIGQHPKIGPQFMERQGLDSCVAGVGVGSLVGIRCQAERLRREQFHIRRSKLAEYFAELLQLVGIVGRNQNGVRCRGHRRREVYGRLTVTKLQLITTPDQARKRLDDVLTEWLTQAFDRPVSKAKARKLLMAGVVRLDGRITRIASLTVSPRSTIEVRIDLAKLFGDSASRDRSFELTAGRILFEDEDLIVVDKPAGLPTHSTADEARDNLVAAVTRFLVKRDGAARLGIHQRLDRDTSGVVLFTKSKRANPAVGKIFSNHEGIKIYQALTVSRPKLKAEWTIKNYLGKIASKSKRASYGAVESGGVYAETSFRVISRHRSGNWIEAIPKTGRTHQIRVHLSEYGLPILGDDLYGPAVSASRLMLHAGQLIFPHPITGADMSVRSPLPDDFERCLARISQ